MNRSVRTIILSSLGAILVSACSSASFFVVNLPAYVSNLESHKNIAYGEKDWQVLDIYAPKDLNTPAPVLVFFYGGRWSYGSRAQYAFAALPFVEEGYIVVIPDYAKYPQVKFPVFVEDGALALRWVHDNIGAYQGDPAQLYLSGHSSGAHIAALVATDPRYLKAYNKDRAIITAFAGLAGPYDFVPEDVDLKDMFGPPENYPRMQVPVFVDGKQPPMLLLQGGDDKAVIQRNLDRLRDKIETTGGVVETKIYDGIDHKEIIGALSWVWHDKAPVTKDMLDFFKKHHTKQ